MIFTRLSPKTIATLTALIGFPFWKALGDSLLFLRPRRFGKSLLLTMLENYYDVAKTAEFDRLFGHLLVGRNPTPLHNQYLVMRWDFSFVTPKPTYEAQQQALTDYLNEEVKDFIRKYESLLTHTIEIDPTNATASFRIGRSLWGQANVGDQQH